MKTLSTIWDKYLKTELIGSGAFADVYKARDNTTGEYVAIKEIKKLKISNSESLILKEIEIMKKLKSENSVLLIDTIETPESYYIIMELCFMNLEQYLKIRKTPLSIDEIREILIDLNNSLKEMYYQNIVHRDLKPSNILLSINKTNINKICFKISDYGLSKILYGNLMTGLSSSGTPYTMAPEILKGNENLLSNKCDIWSLGIIIYFLLFKEYPYNGNEYSIIQQINENKKLKDIDDNELNDLVKRMLNSNINDRINWEDYFEHSFFKHNNNDSYNRLSFPDFRNKCLIHSENLTSYCSNCKCNICDICIKEKHKSHEICPFSKIGFSVNELKVIDHYLKQIDNYLKNINNIKEEINSFVKQFHSNKKNLHIFENDSQNNFKYYTVQCLSTLKEKLKPYGNLTLPIINNQKINKDYIWELRLYIILFLE